jgi:hypothetical protein
MEEFSEGEECTVRHFGLSRGHRSANGLSLFSRGRLLVVGINPCS